MSKVRIKILIFTLGFLIILNTCSYSKILEMDLIIDDEIIKYSAEEVFIKIDDKLVETKEMPPIIINERTSPIYYFIKEYQKKHRYK